MIARLEAQARDPVEAIRMRLKDASELVNTQQLAEIKYDYLQKDESTKGQLAGFVQAQIDEIERASLLLDCDEPLEVVTSSLKEMGASCQRMRKELGDEGVASEVSIARRNLKELQSQLQLYEELPRKLDELQYTVQTNLGELLPVFSKWYACDEWRQKMLHQLHASQHDNQDDMFSSKHVPKALAAIQSRIDGVEKLGQTILNGAWTIVINCIEMVQFDKKRLVDAFQLLDVLEKRRRKRVDAGKVYLTNTLSAVPEEAMPSFYALCRDQLETSLKTRVFDMFAAIAKDDKPFNEAFNGMLQAASSLVLDLESVDRDVAGCFPPQLDAVQVFADGYNAALEEHLTKICSKTDLGVGQKLQLIQWVDYFNTEVGKYKQATPSQILDNTASLMMKLYLEGIHDQVSTWVTNIYNRDEETIVGPAGELHSTRPNDIINILSSQVSIAQEWLGGHLLAKVVGTCLSALMRQLSARKDHFAAHLATTDIEALCSFINDTDVLQSKCLELVDGIAFPGAADHEEEKQKLQLGLGDLLDATSADIVQLAVGVCSLVVSKIFADLEAETTAHWLGKKWDDDEPVVANLLATIEDYGTDIRQWISSSFFNARVLRLALDRCVDEYSKRFIARTAPFNCDVAAGRVHTDTTVLSSFESANVFSKYESEMRRSGLRSNDDWAKCLESMTLLYDILTKKATLDDLQAQLKELELQGILDETSAKRVERMKQLIACVKRTVVPAHEAKKKAGKKAEKPKKTFFKKDKGVAAPVAAPADDAADAASDFQVKTASLESFLGQ
ncbi:hypothetical protein SPRG_09341 [Saprolegnia parasitica CBS 223.65]|uniref:Exocyst complex component Sec6 n=1 Tax=Saprolegnia parasitica (strain CBS 223.65) TaxID=695850 RepID=A0A067C3N7_SAPPC|nr:hypothetical protein SPRG_09341 [Saprolegnia parasitica CBS 223.65]KDO25399.1 hypothetical protein SPRG_09341 [Saprolegnia parasitica CBS 223.65]|eukprot:XP_012203827.1 hypothetical protein SPRG_09341 [Saprolegnia parasitica CBS 223.65]